MIECGLLLNYFDRPQAWAAGAVGVARAALEHASAYAREREAFGRPIGRFQALQHRTADMLIHLEQARSMSLLAAMRCQLDDADVAA
mgnify:CR=1 FL=1